MNDHVFRFSFYRKETGSRLSDIKVVAPTPDLAVKIIQKYYSGWSIEIQNN
jgi:hypothetical protein